MRILSQSGMVDLQYEFLGINIWDKKDPRRNAFCVYAHSSLLNAKPVIMAEYSSQEKAQKAMEMMRDAYCKHEIEKIYSEGNHEVHSYFRFPADDEIEV